MGPKVVVLERKVAGGRRKVAGGEVDRRKDYMYAPQNLLQHVQTPGFIQLGARNGHVGVLSISTEACHPRDYNCMFFSPPLSFHLVFN